MQHEEFSAVVGRLEEVAAVVATLDPEIRSQAFALLSGYVSAPGLSGAGSGVDILAGVPDIDALVVSTMLQAAESASDDLREIMGEVGRVTATKRGLRDVIERICKDIAANPGSEGEAQLVFAQDGLGGEDAYHRVALPALEGGCAGALQTVADDLHPEPITDVRQLQTIRQSLRNRLDAMSELGEMESLRLQMAMDRYSKLMTTLSTLLKKISDTEQGIVQNMK